MGFDDQPKEIRLQVRLLLAGGVGLLVATLATMRIFLPTLEFLTQFSLLPPFARLTIIVKLLSPLLSFVLACAWVWLLLPLGERYLRGDEENTSSMILAQEPLHQHERPKKGEALQKNAMGTVSLQSRERLAAVPPHVQQDPTDLWHQVNLPVTPTPVINPDWSPSDEEEKQHNETRSNNEGDEEEGVVMMQKAQGDVQASSMQIEAERQAQVPPPPSQEEAHEKPAVETLPGARFPLQKSGEPPAAHKPVTLTLLKQMRAWVHADDGTTLEIKMRRGENAIRLIQLAYIAWRRGEPVDRDKMLTYVLARGKRRDMTSDQLGEVFDAAKRYLRQDLDRAVAELANSGHPLSEEVDFFSNEPGFYWLHPSCQVTDLDTIDAYYQVIQVARKEGLLDEKLDGSLPDWVVEACQKLITAYSGDFLQLFLEKFPDEFGPWVKEPVTLYRDRYLDALLLLANYESALGKNYLDDQLSFEQNEEQRRHHIGRAAQFFYDYAMYSLNNRWDQKLKFAYRAGRDGERVVRATRAIRRCVVELGKLGKSDMIDQAYLTFKERMSTLSEGNWKPDKDTESDVADAKRTTSEFRFSSQIPPRQESR